MTTGMVVSDVVTRVSRVFGDDAQVQVNQADIIRWINDCQRDLALANSLFRVTATMTSVAGQSQYSFPTNPAILTLERIKYNGITLEPITIQEADEFLANNDDPASYPSGTPTHYWQWGANFNLYPAPATAITNGIKLYYTRQPNDISAPSDPLDVPAQYHNRVVDYCLMQAYELDDNLYGYQVRKAEYEDKVQKTKDNQDWTDRDSYPHIRVSGADAGDYYEGYGGIY